MDRSHTTDMDVDITITASPAMKKVSKIPFKESKHAKGKMHLGEKLRSYHADEVNTYLRSLMIDEDQMENSLYQPSQEEAVKKQSQRDGSMNSTMASINPRAHYYARALDLM